MHCLFELLFEENIVAPIPSNPTLIVDLGTGSGKWAIDVAEDEKTSSAKVIGIDLSPIQPTDVPENVEFYCEDFIVELHQLDGGRILHESSADLIHSRMVKSGVQEWQWDGLVRRVFHFLKPGVGWAQFTEGTSLSWDGDAVHQSSHLYKVSSLCNEAD